MASTTKPITVCFRARPMNKKEKRHETSVIRSGGISENGSHMIMLESNPNVNDLDVQSISRDTTKMYGCDNFFDCNSSTQDVYSQTTAHHVPRLFSGNNGSTFCFGPTGTGKTFTMFGDENHPGIVRLVGMDIFESLVQKNLSQTSRVKCRLRLSALEIYGDKVRDLLNAGGSETFGDDIRIQSNGEGKSTIQGLSYKYVENYAAYVELVELCREARITESTSANAVSSRSHCIIQIVLHQENEVTGKKMVSKMNLIDLAGSERATVTDGYGNKRSRDVMDKRKRKSRNKSFPRCSNDEHRRSRSRERSTSIERHPQASLKTRLGECQDINSSLLALKEVIRSLVKRKKFIPWRNSKLTRLLEDTLQGEGAAYMIACISKGSAQWMATRDTLEYGTQARMIKLSSKSQRKARRLGMRDLKTELKQSHARCDDLWQENQQLQAQIAELQKILSWKDDQISQLKNNHVSDGEKLSLSNAASSSYASSTSSVSQDQDHIGDISVNIEQW